MSWMLVGASAFWNATSCCSLTHVAHVAKSLQLKEVPAGGCQHSPPALMDVAWLLAADRGAAGALSCACIERKSRRPFLLR